MKSGIIIAGFGGQGVPVLINLFKPRGRLDLPAQPFVALAFGGNLQDLAELRA